MSDDDTPTFTLPACPTCSNIEVATRPFWRIARNVTQKTGARAFHVVGCSHAMEVFGLKSYGDAEIRKLAEENWSNYVERAFDVKVALWSAASIARFRRTLEGRLDVTLPGFTEPLGFGPDAPNQIGRIIRDPASGETSEL